MAIGPLRGDLLVARLLLHRRRGSDPETYALLCTELAAACREAALSAGPYRQWLPRNKSLLLHAPAA
ncbi:hypothetical protein [Streptomyces brasiliensis]|uniref:Uncharacterized protein n=1 Tax=Streptomyces brasiliensis TaxID=1954 RepID=A0A917K6H4_9ACTN|nr:hypothetical protein [Streptomyces brasiliensis]GGJ02538.1 hypothetical protein GCM10010121_011210 [Streptomyces brasiliensis]